MWYLDKNESVQDFSFSVKEGRNVGHYRYINYYDENSYLSELYRFYLPLPNKMRNDQSNFLTLEQYLNSDDITKLNNLGIKTFLDLSRTNLRTTLKLRGYDYPGTNVSPIKNICYVKILVQKFLEKCTINTKESFWYNTKKWSKCISGDITCIVENWDGCTPLPNHTIIDVHGIGDVPVPSRIDDSSSDLEEMHCKQDPTQRYSSAGIFVDGKTFLMGGQGKNSTLFQDTWSRDDNFPRSNMKIKPTSRSTQSKFVFDSDEDGATQFEYKLLDSIERLHVTPWLKTTVDEIIDVSWLDSKKGGPGTGWYTLYLRAIDPSGNRDASYMILQNVYTWYYIQPLPWGNISFGILALALAITFAYLQYRRIQRKAALERFAKRQMKRKFKLNAMSSGGKHDWKEYYHNQAIQKKIKTHRKNTISRINNGLENEAFSKDRLVQKQRNTRTSSIQNDDEKDWKKRRRERRSRREKARQDLEGGYLTEEEEDIYRKSTNRNASSKKSRKRYNRKEYSRKKKYK